MAAKSQLVIAGRTHVGLVRKNNEDKFLIDMDLGLMIVADGMGGHNAGELASELAASTVWDLAHEGRPAEAADPNLSTRGRRLESYVKAANARIFREGASAPKNHGMGTTIVAVLADARSMTVAHVGDSRLYLHRAGTLTQLTEDHSIVGEQIRKGLINPEAAERAPFANILTRALGSQETVQIDVFDRGLASGDIVLLATDGLTKMAREKDIADAIGDGRHPEELVERLIELALVGGGQDNVTVVVARVASSR